LGISPLGSLVVRFHACVYTEYLTPCCMLQNPMNWLIDWVSSWPCEQCRMRNLSPTL